MRKVYPSIGLPFVVGGGNIIYLHTILYYHHSPEMVGTIFVIIHTHHLVWCVVEL